MFVPEEAGWRYCPAQPRRLVRGSSTMKPRVKTPPVFKTRRDVARYFGGKTIECLLCGQRFRRLAGHLAAKHEISVDEYRGRFGLPWSRGLTSAASVASSGWTDERKAKARKLVRVNRFFRTGSCDAATRTCPVPEGGSGQKLGQACGRLWQSVRAKSACAVQ